MIFVGLIIDEMKVKEGLVYNKSDGKVIGFTALGAINDEMDEEEQKPVAKQYLYWYHVQSYFPLCSFWNKRNYY